MEVNLTVIAMTLVIAQMSFIALYFLLNHRDLLAAILISLFSVCISNVACVGKVLICAS